MQHRNKKMRHELKYYIHPYDYAGLRIRLQSALQLDKHSVNEDGYHIRSLYFDDAYDSALYQKNYGVQNRNKYRIRIYNKSDAVINLERKSKFGDYICKESASMTRNEYERIVVGDIDFLQHCEVPLVRDFYFQMKHHDMRPKVVVDYIREAYTLNIQDARITFDKALMANVQSLDIFNMNLATVHAIKDPMIIMEVKYNDFMPQFVKDTLRLFSHHRSAISKYVICREESMKCRNL